MSAGKNTTGAGTAMRSDSSPATSMRRILPVVEKGSPLGAWGMESPTCPMHKHQDAIGAKREECVKGIQTNMQGPIPISQCKYAAKLDYDNLHVDCSFQDKP